MARQMVWARLDARSSWRALEGKPQSGSEGRPRREVLYEPRVPSRARYACSMIVVRTRTLQPPEDCVEAMNK